MLLRGEYYCEEDKLIEDETLILFDEGEEGLLKEEVLLLFDEEDEDELYNESA